MYRRGTIEFTRSQSISYRLINFSGFLFDFFSKGSSETISGLKKSSTFGGVGFKNVSIHVNHPVCQSMFFPLSPGLAPPLLGADVPRHREPGLEYLRGVVHRRLQQLLEVLVLGQVVVTGSLPLGYRLRLHYGSEN